VEKILKEFRRTLDVGRWTTVFTFHVPRSTSHVALCALSLFLIFSSFSYAEDKTWNADSAQTDWFDVSAWMPTGVPDASDDVLMDKLDSNAMIGQDFHLKSLTLGGKKTSTVTVNNFVAGNVKPANSTDVAILNRRGGHMVLKGSAGKVTLNAAYKDSEEVVPEEPSFMFYVK
jgi:hypothetical protein